MSDNVGCNFYFKLLYTIFGNKWHTHGHQLDKVLCDIMSGTEKQWDRVSWCWTWWLGKNLWIPTFYHLLKSILVMREEKRTGKDINNRLWTFRFTSDVKVH